MTLQALTRLAAASLLACLQMTAGAHAACAGPDDMQGADCRSWIDSDRPVFATHDGKLYRTHFNSLYPEVLVDHGFSALEFLLSADGRYLVYVGRSGAHWSAYVYDTLDEMDHPLPVADMRLVQLAISPDSRKLAWADLSPQAGRQGIVIMNLADRSMQSVHYPVDVRTLADDRMTKVYWSLDGGQLLVGSIVYPKGAYYRIGLPGLSVASVDGRYVPPGQGRDPAEEGMHFSRGGQELAYYRQPCLQSQCPIQGRPGAGQSVRIDGNYRLTVIGADGVEQVVARGGCASCGGASVRALSWLEPGKYLVYEFKGAAYVYGVVEGRTSRLFDPGWQFGWHDDANATPARFP